MNARRSTIRLTLISLAAALLLGCTPGGEPLESSGPVASVKSFYRHLNEGNYDEAKALYTAEARQAVEDPELFRSWAEQATRQGTISEIQIISESDQEGSASVEFEIVFADGSVEQHTVELSDQDGDWKLGLIL